MLHHFCGITLELKFLTQPLHSTLWSMELHFLQSIHKCTTCHFTTYLVHKNGSRIRMWACGELITSFVYLHEGRTEFIKPSNDKLFYNGIFTHATDWRVNGFAICRWTSSLRPSIGNRYTWAYADHSWPQSNVKADTEHLLASRTYETHPCTVGGFACGVRELSVQASTITGAS